MARKIKFLLLLNAILVAASWVMIAYSYPRLPTEIPYWVGIFGTQNVEGTKSVFIFIYPITQTGLNFFFPWISIKTVKKKSERISQESTENKRIGLKKEVSFLALIFINLIFIHLEKSLILVAHHLEQGINSYYFYMLFGILLLLIPYYKFREKLGERQGFE